MKKRDEYIKITVIYRVFLIYIYIYLINLNIQFPSSPFIRRVLLIKCLFYFFLIFNNDSDGIANIFGRLKKRSTHTPYGSVSLSSSA